MKRIALLTVALFGLGLRSAAAVPIVINFEGDTSGPKPNGFVSSSSPVVKFYDTMGADLALYILLESNFTRGLAVIDDDASRLKMTFASPFNTLKLDFGNDDPTVPGDLLAWLDVFSGTTLVGEVSKLANHNDFMDQTISMSGVTFDNALFWYGDASGNPLDLIEVVDNVVLDMHMPEPSSFVLLGTGAVALAAGRLRRRRQ